jgi:ParB family transcriptional regulator, chromosome partitioning protein
MAVDRTDPKASGVIGDIMAHQKINIVSMADRTYQLISIDRIKVLNSRNRDESQFQDNINSIESTGLLKPILVNEKYLQSEGYYQLVCGEGRYIAHKRLNRETIPAEVINCDRTTALLLSLVENIARVPPNTMWFARELKRMKDCGLSIQQIAVIACKSESYVFEYIRLVELGEERLIRGVEARLFPISFATNVAKSSNKTIQNVLMDAFDSGLINSVNATRVRNLIERRIHHGRRARHPQGKAGKDAEVYNLKTLEDDISKATEQKEGFVHKATTKENRLFALVDGLNTVWCEEAFRSLLKEEGMADRPSLLGEYATAVESGRSK